MPAKQPNIDSLMVWPTMFMLGLVTGCGTQEATPVNPNGPGTPAKGPGPDLGDIQQDLKDIKKDATPPVII
jgi:hypothetical protein